jgi:ketosteroid isomerase-like protein
MRGEVEAAESELRAAMLGGDVAALDRLIDDALVFVAIDGSVVSKADDLAMHRSGAIKITRLEPSDQRIALHNDAAVVSVKMSASAILNGQTMNNTLRYTRFWLKRDGAWRLVGGHMSQLA